MGLMDGLIGVTRKGSIDRLIGLMDGLIGVIRKGSIDRLIGLMDGLIGFDLGFGGWIGSPSGRGTLENGKRRTRPDGTRGTRPQSGRATGTLKVFGRCEKPRNVHW